MRTQVSTQFDAEALRAFDEDRRQRLLVAVRYACLASILALAAFVLFDSFWHVSDLRNFLYARTLTLASLLLVLVASFTPAGVRFIDQLAVVACLFFSAGAVLVAELAGGGLSIYRDPIYIIFIGFTLLIPWKPVAAGLCFASGIVFYDVLYLFTGGTGYLGTWLVSNVLLGIGAAIATVSVAAINRLQRIEFGYRRRLRDLDERLFSIGVTDDILPNLERSMRAPFTLLAAPIDLLLAGNDLTHAQREQLELCRRNATRLLRMADQAVAVAHLQADTFRPRHDTVDLADLVARALDEVRPIFKRRRIELVLASSAKAAAQGEASSYEQGLLAMLALALDVAKAGGTVTLAASAADGGIEVSVRDNGVGLSADELQTLTALPHDTFEAVALPPARLALLAARHRLERHGARLEVTSVLGQGTTQRMWAPSP